jgi:hypothetical protein
LAEAVVLPPLVARRGRLTSPLTSPYASTVATTFTGGHRYSTCSAVTSLLGSLMEPFHVHLSRSPTLHWWHMTRLLRWCTTRVYRLAPAGCGTTPGDYDNFD